MANKPIIHDYLYLVKEVAKAVNFAALDEYYNIGRESGINAHQAYTVFQSSDW